MKISSFFAYAGPGKISIARAAPRGMAGFRIYRPLAPGPWFNSVDEGRYRELYFAQLGQLNAEVVWRELHNLAGDGVEPVLCCWERAPLNASNWCHRTMVAEWFKSQLDQVLTEVEPRKGSRDLI